MHCFTEIQVELGVLDFHLLKLAMLRYMSMPDHRRIKALRISGYEFQFSFTISTKNSKKHGWISLRNLSLKIHILI